MKQKNERKKSRGSRIPLADPAKNRHIFYLNEADEFNTPPAVKQVDCASAKAD